MCLPEFDVELEAYGRRLGDRFTPNAADDERNRYVLKAKNPKAYIPSVAELCGSNDIR